MIRDDSPTDPAGARQQPQAPQTSEAFQTPPATPAPNEATATATATAERETTGEREAAAPQQQRIDGIRDLSIWDTGKADEFRHRWHDVQTHFVEDPSGSVTEARQLVDEAVQTLSASVHDREEQLERAGARSSDSTEGMRDTVLQYHHLLDRLLAV